MLLRKLSELNGVSGNEKEVRDFIINKIKDYVDDIKIDRLGNIIVYKKGLIENGTKIVVSAHMDEVGLMINKIDSGGLLGFTLVGDIDSRVLISKPVLVGDNKIEGVIGAKPIHLQKKDERKKSLEYNQLYIDIGSSSKEESEKLVNIGDYVSFNSNFINFGDDLVKGKALDNRAGCNILIDTIKRNSDISFYAVFSVMKEIGIFGGEPANYYINPDINIILDSSFKEKSLNNGPIISFMENRTHFSRDLTEKLASIAKDNNIDYQLSGFDCSSSDANKIQTSSNGSKIVRISIPCRYKLSPANVMSTQDINNTEKLLMETLKLLGGNDNGNK